MATFFSIKSDGGPGIRADIARVIMRVGCCTGGVAGTLYEAAPGQDLTPTLGYGPLAIADARASIFARNAQRFALKVPATTAGTIGAVTKSGNGPAIAVAGSPIDEIGASPWIAAKLRVKVIKAGALGVARAAVALDGASYVYELDIPAQSAPTVIGTVDLYTLDLSTLNGLTVELGAVTVTLTTPSSVANLVAQIDAATGYSADLVQGKFLRVRKDAAGPSEELIFGDGTAHAALGLPDPDVIPAEPATLTGSLDVTGSGNFGDGGILDSRTFIVTSDTGAATTTFDDPADLAAVAAQITAEAAGKYFAAAVNNRIVLTSATEGDGGTLLIGSGTANPFLGFTNGQSAQGTNEDIPVAATGGASTATLPGTGLVLTFAPGDYELGEVYACNTTAPRASLADILAAITAAIAAEPLVQFMHMVPVQAPLDEVDLRAYADGLDVICAAQEAAEDARFLRWMVGAPLDGSDAADKAAVLSHVSRRGTVVTRDCYMTAPTSQPQGRLRVSAVEQAAIRRAAAPSFSEDLGRGEYGALECTLVGADGTLARNEAVAPIKLGGSKGPGFAALTLKNGLAYFKRGVTRAGSTSRFVDEGVATATSALAAVLFARLRGFENATFELNPDGTLAEFEAAALEDAFEEPIKEQFVRAKHFSRVLITVDRDEKMSDSRKLKIHYKVQIRGQGEDVEGTLTVGGTLTSAE